MTDKIVLIGKPSIDEEKKAEILISLRQIIVDVEAGIVDEVVLIMHRTDGAWSDSTPGVRSFSEWIGRLEIVKQKWIESYTRVERV